MEPVYITGKKKVIPIKKPFARVVVHGKSSSYFITIPIDVIREFGIEKGDLLLGEFQHFIPLMRKNV
jgi:hypothetical protein